MLLPLTQTLCSSYYGSRWRFEKVGGGAYAIHNMLTKYPLTLDTMPSHNNQIIGLKNYNSWNQHWIPIKVNNFQFLLQNVRTKQCVEHFVNPQRFRMGNCSTLNPTQMFHIEKPTDYTSNFPGDKWVNLKSGNDCVNNQKGNAPNAGKCKNNPISKVVFGHNFGLLIIQSKVNRLVFNNEAFGKKNGNRIIYWPISKTSNEVWAPIYVNTTTFILFNPESGKCIKRVGPNFQLWDCCVNDKAQHFSVPGVNLKKPIKKC